MDYSKIAKSMKLCGGRRCCPTVKIEGNVSFITDDYGNTVKMETSQLKQLIDEGVSLFNDQP